MKDILSGWREHGLVKSKRMIVISIVTLLVFFISGVAYYLHSKKAEKEQLEKTQQQLVESEKKRISDFYSENFHGYQFNDFIVILEQLLLSSYSLTTSGFTEDAFACNTDNCNFLYKLKPRSVFNVQEKIFFNQAYEGIISPDSLAFSDLNLKYTDRSLEEKITNQDGYRKIPFCNDYINYVYAYNSSNASENKKIRLNELPSSIITDLEDKYEDYSDSHKLLFSKIEMTFRNNPLEVKYLLEKQPYIDYYVFKSIDKIDNNNIKVTGVFACKR